MTVLGPLRDESPEPMTKEEFQRVRRRLREIWNGSVTLKKTLEQLISEFRSSEAGGPHHFRGAGKAIERSHCKMTSCVLALVDAN